MTGPSPEGPDPGQVLTDLARVNRVLSRAPDDAQAAEAVEAVVSLVPTFAVPKGPAGTWAGHQCYGATLLAARLERRKDSPGGMAEFGIEGAAYVSGNWTDVAMLLGLGQYSVGRVG